MEVVLRSSPSYAEGRKLIESSPIHCMLRAGVRWPRTSRMLCQSSCSFELTGMRLRTPEAQSGTDGNPSAEDGFEAGSLTQILADSYEELDADAARASAAASVHEGPASRGSRGSVGKAVAKPKSYEMLTYYRRIIQKSIFLQIFAN